MYEVLGGGSSSVRFSVVTTRPTRLFALRHKEEETPLHFSQALLTFIVCITHLIAFLPGALAARHAYPQCIVKTPSAATVCVTVDRTFCSLNPDTKTFCLFIYLFIIQFFCLSPPPLALHCVCQLTGRAGRGDKHALGKSNCAQRQHIVFGAFLARRIVLV